METENGKMCERNLFSVLFYYCNVTYVTKKQSLLLVKNVWLTNFNKKKKKNAKRRYKCIQNQLAVEIEFVLIIFFIE